MITINHKLLAAIGPYLSFNKVETSTGKEEKENVSEVLSTVSDRSTVHLGSAGHAGLTVDLMGAP